MQRLYGGRYVARDAEIGTTSPAAGPPSGAPRLEHREGQGCGGAARELFLSGSRFVLPLAALGYLIVLYRAAAVVNLPLFELRLLAPAHTALSLAAAVIIARAAPLSGRTLSRLVVAVALLCSAIFARELVTTCPENDRAAIERSARLQWIARDHGGRPDRGR